MDFDASSDGPETLSAAADNLSWVCTLMMEVVEMFDVFRKVCKGLATYVYMTCAVRDALQVQKSNDYLGYYSCICGGCGGGIDSVDDELAVGQVNSAVCGLDLDLDGRGRRP